MYFFAVHGLCSAFRCLVNTIILVLLAVLPQSHAAVYVFRSETDSGFRAGTTDITATLYIAVTGTLPSLYIFPLPALYIL